MELSEYCSRRKDQESHASLLAHSSSSSYRCSVLVAQVRAVFRALNLAAPVAVAKRSPCHPERSEGPMH